MATATKSKHISSLRGLERQRAFLDEIKKNKLAGDSFFIIDKVMESMRDNGYRDIRKALNDLIDNAEQAGARRVAVTTTVSKNEKKGKDKIISIAVIDDGHGMLPEMLPIAVKWGGTDRHGERDGLGRFGFGLPTASISVTRLYEVYSKVKGGEWHKIQVNLKEIAAKAVKNGGNLHFPLKAERTELPLQINQYIKAQWKLSNLEHGSVVLLHEPDRIRRFTEPKTFEARMLQNIGLTYRHYIPNLSFWVNEKKVEMIDPLFLNPISIGYDAGNNVFAEGADEQTIHVRNTLVEGKVLEGNMRLRYAFMHPTFQRDNEGGLIKNRWNTMKGNNGYFVVTRAGRQIDVVKEPYYQSDDDNITIVNYDANWVIELDFDPALDELFGITNNKQQVEIDSSIWDLLKSHDLPAKVRSFRKKGEKIRNQLKQEANRKKQLSRDSEQVMLATEKFDRLNVSDEKQNEGTEKLQRKAQEVATKEKRNVNEVIEELQGETEKRRFKIEFSDLPGAPFYDFDYWGAQFQIRINTAHRFYSDVYMQQDDRGKTALELLLFILGKCEVQADGDKAMFYGNERFEWSRKLEMTLQLLDKRDPLLDRQSNADELGGN